MSLISAHRSPQSHVAGGAALNRSGVRLSADIDIFNDPGLSVEAVAQRDVDVLQSAGLVVTWTSRLPSFQSAKIEADDEETRLDWAQDSAWRFFPAEPDSEFGYMLQPADLATNKVLAAATRSTARDTVDLVYVDEHILSLGALVCAAVGKDEGFTPEALLQWVSRFTPRRSEEYADVAAIEPVDVPLLRRKLHEALARGRDYVEQVPSDQVGYVFLQAGKLIAPAPGEWDRYERRGASVGGIWPSSPEISSAMLERPE